MDDLKQPKPYADQNHRGNSPYYHTGKPCIEQDCDAPAGTAWSPHWCFAHNVERIERISRQLNEITAHAKAEGK